MADFSYGGDDAGEHDASKMIVQGCTEYAVTPAKAGVQELDSSGFRRSPE
jgi:hypothetical protein